MIWTDAQLREALNRFEQEHIDAKLLPNSIRSYVDYAGRFLRWRAGDYRPRDAVGPGPRRSLVPVTTDDLRADLSAYELDLRAAARRPAAVRTYVDHASRFIRWLDGLFVTGGPRAARTPGAGSRAARAPDLSWAWEGAVQAALVTWLQATGWTIEREADTKSGQHGIDILAARGADRLAVEVKGYPQATYARGERAGQTRKWHPASQARTYFGTAVHVAMVMRDARRDAQIAIALPDVAGYRTLLDQVHASLGDLGVRMLLVRPDGSVLEPYMPGVRLPSALGRRVR